MAQKPFVLLWLLLWTSSMKQRAIAMMGPIGGWIDCHPSETDPLDACMQSPRRLLQSRTRHQLFVSTCPQTLTKAKTIAQRKRKRMTKMKTGGLVRPVYRAVAVKRC